VIKKVFGTGRGAFYFDNNVFLYSGNSVFLHRAQGIYKNKHNAMFVSRNFSPNARRDKKGERKRTMRLLKALIR